MAIIRHRFRGPASKALLVICISVLQSLHPVNAATPTVLSKHQRKAITTQVSTAQDETRHGVKKVLIIGASVAHGWKDDKQAGGYLKRAFTAISDVGTNHLQVYNKAISGKCVKDIVDRYPQWLNRIKPDVVVLAWGVNDLAAHTPLSDYRAQIDWEIQSALQQHAVVLVVTTPVSIASYTTYKTAQPQLISTEMTAANQLHNANVHVFDIFHQMKQYISQHHQSYRAYAGDAWHPNAAGHQLAAQLLVQDWFHQFGNEEIHFA